MDKRTISNLTPIEGAVEAIKQAEAVVCTTQDPGFPRRLAIVSQSLTGASRVAVHTDCVGYESVDERQLVPLLFAAIKELSAEVETLKAKRTRKAAQPSE